MSDFRFRIGFDLGSTTVKAVVVDDETDEIVWQDYRRHDSKQAEKALTCCSDIERDAGVKAGNARMFITGSGGATSAGSSGRSSSRRSTRSRWRSRSSIPRSTR